MEQRHGCISKQGQRSWKLLAVALEVIVEDIRRDIVAVLSLKSVGAGNFHFLTGKIPPFRRVCVTSRVTKAIGRSPKTCTNEHVLAKNQNFSGTMPRIRWRPSHTPPCRRCGAARLLAPLGSLILQSPVKFFRQLLSAHAERNSTKTGHMLGTERHLKIYVRNLEYTPTNRRPKTTTFFDRLHNWTATLTACIFWTKHDINNQSSVLATRRRLYIVSKQHELWSTNGFKLDLHFYPPYVNSAFCFIASLRRLRSANRIQPNYVKRWTVDRAIVKKLGSSLPKNWGPKNFYICSVFDDFET